MKVVASEIPDVLILEPDVFEDPRGYFYESYNRQRLKQHTGIDLEFVQDNHSKSGRGVLRGLHYQIQQSQAKLIRVISGEVFDVAVDLRKQSPSFGRWVGITLSASDRRQLWIPEGFAHGFQVLSESAELLYKASDYYAPRHERCIAWDDATLNIDWPLAENCSVSDKDATGVSFEDADLFA